MGVNSATEVTNPVIRGTYSTFIAVISLYVGVKARRERVTEEEESRRIG